MRILLNVSLQGALMPTKETMVDTLACTMQPGRVTSRLFAYCFRWSHLFAWSSIAKKWNQSKLKITRLGPRWMPSPMGELPLSIVQHIRCSDWICMYSRGNWQLSEPGPLKHNTNSSGGRCRPFDSGEMCSFLTPCFCQPMENNCASC